ncbi:unconventional myosin-IXb-like [Ascaphus truei]|uniref:unconventional myosin-IXb-like n=1 Tax=Ascaphus truei TaxID=8439 RepID=UPI003F5A9DF9
MFSLYLCSADSAYKRVMGIGHYKSSCFLTCFLSPFWTDPSSVKLDNYPIHAITGILKQWLRELPEPLMTFAQYNEFLQAVELPGKQEQLCAIYKVLGQLPQAHYNTLERLIFHLVKVAVMEDANRMSPNSLAIIFAPCLLRCPANYDLQTTMKEFSKTITCVEMLIKEQMRQYILKIKEIGMMKAAETQALCSLSLLKHNTVECAPKGSPCSNIL